MTAALIVMVRGGRTVLVNPQEPVLKMPSHTHRRDVHDPGPDTARTAPDASSASGRQETRASD
jgi:hypothetical protein